VFSRRGKSAEVSEPVEATVGKGRATPKRRDAEQERRARVKGPRDPKARAKFDREKRTEARRKQHEGMMRGDDRYLQPRDSGPRRRFIRDWIDAKFTVAEAFLPCAVVILLLGLFGASKSAQAASVAIWMLVVALIIVDTIIWSIALRRLLSRRFPEDSRAGDLRYAIMRAMLVRRMRTPKPQVKRGQKP
jgi:hypothetical protein